MRKLSHQQIFTKAVRGVVRQGSLAMTQGACKYRAVKGEKVLMCGVGQLISTDVYASNFEGCSAGHCGPTDWHRDNRAPRLGLALIFSGVDVTDTGTVDLLDQIQSAHDCAHDLQDFIRGAKDVATQFGLQMPRLS